MTGAIIGLSITNPVALPLAFASHYVLDGIPHHGQKGLSISSKMFNVMLVLDTLLCIALVIILALKHPAYWWLAGICAFLAASPDFMWFGDFMRVRRGQPRRELQKRREVVRLHAWIQWFEKPVGIIVELTWAAAMIVFLAYLLKT